MLGVFIFLNGYFYKQSPPVLSGGTLTAINHYDAVYLPPFFCRSLMQLSSSDGIVPKKLASISLVSAW